MHTQEADVEWHTWQCVGRWWMHAQGLCACIHWWALCIYMYMDMDMYRDGAFIGMGEGPAGPVATVVATTLMQRNPSCELAFDAVTRLHVLSAEGSHANWDERRCFRGTDFMPL